MKPVVAISILLLVSGCTVLEARPDATRYFVLSATPGAASETSAVVCVGPARLPDYLLRPEIVRRAGENQLQPSAADRWGEAIDRAFLRVLCLDLAARMPKSTVVAYPPAAHDDPGAWIEVEVSAFEGSQAGDVRLDARWTVRDAKTGSRVAHEAKLAQAGSSGEAPATVAAMSALLGELADRIAQSLASG